MDETAHGGPFPEILEHDIFLNCILATEKTPIFIPNAVKTTKRKLMVIGDIACDPRSSYSPIKVYDQVTSWQKPVKRVWDKQILDVTAIDNLPSLLPRESSEDFATQLLPNLMSLNEIETGVWEKAHAVFKEHIKDLK
jgi:saccharopine dehydrogenase (NAD+, L-lysine-forming)